MGQCFESEAGASRGLERASASSPRTPLFLNSVLTTEAQRRLEVAAKERLSSLRIYSTESPASAPQLRLASPAPPESPLLQQTHLKAGFLPR